jgi:hypothetical protein
MKSKPYPLILLLTLLFFTCTSALSQISVGAKAGYNFNSIRGDKEYDVVPGFAVGGFAKYPITDFLMARAEVLYFQQAANLIDYYVLPGELYHSRARVTFHNIQIPILAEFGLPSLSEENLKPKLLIGGFYSYTLSAKENYNNIITVDGYETISYKGSTDVTSLFNRSQYGLQAAIVAEMKAFGYPVSMEFRYQYNLNPFSEGDNANQYNLSATHEYWGDKLYLSTLSFNIGVKLIDL